MDFSNKIELLETNFSKNFIKLSKFNLSYKISRFFSKDVDLFDYTTKKKNFIFYKDKSWVETHLSVYKSIDKSDNSKGIVFELIIWETKQKDIMFFSEWKIYNIIQNKWWKIIETHIIEDDKKINLVLEFLEKELNYISSKISRYQNKLRVKWVLLKNSPEHKVESFKEIFTQSILQIS